MSKNKESRFSLFRENSKNKFDFKPDTKIDWSTQKVGSQD